MTKFSKLILILVAFFAGIFVMAPVSELNSTPPTDVSDTLSSSQLSFFSRVGVSNVANDSFVRIQLSGNPSNTTSNLAVGDTIGIGRSGSNGLDIYTVNDIGNTGLIQINTGLSAPNSFNGNMLIATRSAIHTVTFTPQSNIAGGVWEFLIKATSRAGEIFNDGIPDQEGFDLGSDIPAGPSAGSGTRLKAADVTCPWSATASVGTTAIVNDNTYHVITCTLAPGGTNPINVTGSVIIGRDLASGSQLINPAASVNRVSGGNSSSADVYTFYVRHRDNLGSLLNVDTIQGKIAVTESVRVTATVDPTLTFTIDNTGVSPTQNICGGTMPPSAANTTSTSIAFGSIGLQQFNNLAQRITCTTNSEGGYSVTVYETAALTNVATGTTIPDTDCDNGTCNVGTTDAWVTDFETSGWGFSMENISAHTLTFDYGGSTNFYAKPFGIGSANAQLIMQNPGLPTTNESAYMCYRLSVSNRQEAGRYETNLIYTATANF